MHAAKYRNIGDKYQLVLDDGKIRRYTDLYMLIKDVNTHAYIITNPEALPVHFRELINQ
jgi:hypothetical protein